MIDFLSHVRADSDRIAAVAAMGMDAAVPSCPGWTVADLVAHTGMVYAHKTTIVRDRWIDEQPSPVTPPTAGVLDWFRRQADEMLEVLSAEDPATRVATWDPQNQTVGFWWRRMAHESVIHRLDAELAHDVVSPVDGVLGADGIDEILVAMMVGAPDWAESSKGEQVVAIIEVDGGRSWRLRVGDFTGTSPTGRAFSAEPTLFIDTTGDAVAASLRGPAGTVDSWLWGRANLAELEVSGDQSLIHLVRSVAAASTS